MPSVKIGTSIRNFKEDKNPGPGAHNLLESSFHYRHQSPRAIIGHSTRSEINKKRNFPGPANYSPHKDIIDATHFYNKISMLGCRKYDLSGRGG